MNVAFWNPVSWFIGGEQRQAPRGLLIDERPERVKVSKDNADRQAKDGYAKYWAAYRCVNLIAQSASRVHWDLFAVDSDGKLDEQIFKHPVLKLIADPNPLVPNGKLFWFSNYAWFAISGNSYLRAIGPDNGENAGVPKELWNLAPPRMGIKVGTPADPIRFYTHTVKGKPEDFPFEEVLHDRTFNPILPDGDWFGLSPIQVGAVEIDSGVEGAIWNLSLMRNSGRPSAIITVNGTLTDAQYSRYNEQIEDRLLSPMNRGRPIVFDYEGENTGKVTYSQLSLSPKDMDWLNQHNVSAKDVAQLYGIAPELIGDDKSKTFANGKEARLAFWEDTVVPIVDAKTESLNEWLLPKYPDGENLRLVPNFDTVPALKAAQQALFDRANSASFLTVDQKLEMVGKPPRGPERGGDAVLVPMNLVPLEAIAGGIALPPQPPDETPDGDEGDDDD